MKSMQIAPVLLCVVLFLFYTNFAPISMHVTLKDVKCEGKDTTYALPALAGFSEKVLQCPQCPQCLEGKETLCPEAKVLPCPDCPAVQATECPEAKVTPCPACPAVLATQCPECPAVKVRPCPEQKVTVTRCADGEEMKIAEANYQENLRARENKYPHMRGEDSGWSQAPINKEALMVYYLTPLYPCFPETHIGYWGEGGKWICQLNKLDSSSLVYSVGSRGETSFEDGVHQRTGAVVHTFDPTLPDNSIARLKGFPSLEFHNIGWHGVKYKARRSGVPEFHRDSRTLRATEVMETLGHSYVDVLKIDCEECERGVIADIFALYGKYTPDNKRFRLLFGQILVEFHNLSEPTVLIPILQMLEDLGYRMFHGEPNFICPMCFEAAYIHESLVKPKI